MLDDLRFKIPAEFVRGKVGLRIGELALGYQERWIDARTVIDLAAAGADDGEDASLRDQLAILLCADRERLSEILSHPTLVIPASAGDLWRYLALAWLYEHRDDVAGVFDIVEMIYADAGYPEDMEGFVPYLPAPPGVAAGVDRLLLNWAAYIQENGRRFRDRAVEDES